MQTKAVQTFCECQEVDIYSVTELTYDDIASQNRRQASIPVCVKFLSDSLKGLIIMHGKDYTHGKITGKNILITKLKPTEVRLSNFKNTLKVDSFWESDLGPTYLLPPEASREHYTKACDIYSLAMVFCSIAFPDAYKKHVDYTQPQGPTFRDEMAKCLKEMACQTANLRDLANTVKRMLSANADERPTAAFVLSHVPTDISQMDHWAAKSPADDGPTRKKAKLRDISGSGSLKYQSTAGSVTLEGKAFKTSDTEHWHDGISGVESSAYVMSITQTSNFTFGSEGGLPDLK